KFERPKADDPNKGTINEKRHGAFPVAVALETKVPAAWLRKIDSFAEDDVPVDKRPTVRVVAIGHGGVFIAPTLSPVREKLLLDTCNWLLGRDDLLAKDNRTWEYPRVTLTAAEKNLWKLGAWLGLPLVCIYLGMVMWLVR